MLGYPPLLDKTWTGRAESQGASSFFARYLKRFNAASPWCRFNQWIWSRLQRKSGRRYERSMSGISMISKIEAEFMEITTKHVDITEMEW
jgi:hypothetical protein